MDTSLNYITDVLVVPLYKKAFIITDSYQLSEIKLGYDEDDDILNASIDSHDTIDL